MNDENLGWFAEHADDDRPTNGWPWRPALQLDGMVYALDVWFKSRSECEEFIRAEVIGRGMREETA